MPCQDVIRAAVDRAGGNRTRAARELGVSRGWLLRKLGEPSPARGRPRRESSDAAIARIARHGLGPTEVWRTLRLAGHDVSRGTVIRRMREQEGGK